MAFDVKVAGEDEADVWDSVAATCSHGTVFHSWQWLKTVEQQTKTKLIPLLIYNGTTLVSIYPFFIKNYIGKITMAFSPPPKAYLLYLGPLIVDYEKLKQHKKESTFINIQEAVDAYLIEHWNCKYIRIRTPPGLIDSRPFRWQGYCVEPMYTYR
ncbi:hypothetical protein, partial [Methanocalculus sp.]|uniref:hypothetical protein n=1 Tax=Methanocalculus sp. TaxID=2004547 RepID=UPI00262BFDEC